MPTVLVVGGAGYIGSHVARYLLDKGYDVVVFDNLATGHRQMVDERATFVEGDLLYPESVRHAFNDRKIDVVMHFAAYSLVGESVKEPLKYYRNNVGGAVNLLTAMLEADAKLLVFSSSAAVYGEPDEVPISESAPLRPTNPYGETKAIIERMLTDAERAHGIRSVCLRYFNAAGAAYSVGEWHEHETHLIPLILSSAAEGKTVTIFGDDYDTPDGTCIRDYIHVFDLARAHEIAAKHLLTGGGSRAYNLGTENGQSVKEVIAACEQATEKRIPFTVGPRRPGDPARLVASAALIKKELNWQPEHSIKDIVASAWEWQKRLAEIKRTTGSRQKTQGHTL